MGKLISMTISLVVLATLYSCNNDKIQIFKKEIIELKSKNDSLNKILSIISKKYVFDSIAIYNRPRCDNTFEIGSTYRKDFIISAYNNSDFFIKHDTIINGKMINADTIYYLDGAYTFIDTIRTNSDILKIKMQTGDKKYGDYIQGTLFDKIPLDGANVSK